MPSIRLSQLETCYADQGVTTDNFSQFFLGPTDSLRRLNWEHHITRICCRVPDANLDLRRQIQSHLFQYGARLAHDPCPVLQVFVPVRRKSNDSEGRARALRTANHVLERRGVLEHDEVAVMFRHCDPKLRNCRGTIGQQPSAE